MTPSEQRRARLLAWQARHFGTRKGAQGEAARACNVPPGTYRNWLTRAEVPGPVVRLMDYVDRFGLLHEEGGDKEDRRIEWQGRLYTIVELAEQSGMSRKVLWARLARGWDVEKAMTTPVRKRGKGAG